MPQAAPEDRPLVSIVTSVYNRLAYAQPSLDSLLAQTWPNFEIVMVDDGSTDGTEDWLDSLTDPRIRVLRQENQGNGAGLNTAIAAARGELIAIHDFGDICHPDRVARQAEVLLSHTEIGVVSCWLSRRDVVSGDRTYLHHRKTLPFRDAILRSAPFSHGEVMYRKALWRAAGGYRREFRYAVDRDLFIRLSRLCEYHVIEEELYEQLLFPGGISSTTATIRCPLMWRTTSRSAFSAYHWASGMRLRYCALGGTVATASPPVGASAGADRSSPSEVWSVSTSGPKSPVRCSASA